MSALAPFARMGVEDFKQRLPDKARELTGQACHPLAANERQRQNVGALAKPEKLD